jgi:DNA-binding GntR family transcriptional regulator
VPSLRHAIQSNWCAQPTLDPYLVYAALDHASYLGTRTIRLIRVGSEPDPDPPKRPSEVKATPVFSRLSTLTKGEAAYAEIRARILDASLRPGSVINQGELAEVLGISVTPLREALRRLEGEGLVAIAAEKTVSVVTLTTEELAELRAVRLRLDPFAALLAAESATSEQRARLSAMADFALDSDVLTWHTDHRAFHRTIHEISGNGFLYEVLGQIQERLDRYRVVSLKQQEWRQAESKAPHAEIATVIASGDGKAAEKLMMSHIWTVLGDLNEMGTRYASDAQP